jgi:SAM-dependent methyltransferase
MDGPASHNELVEPAWDEGLENCSNCLFCGGEQAHQDVTDVRDVFFAADEGRFDFLRCDNCGSIWLSKRPFGQRLLDAYANYYTHGSEAGENGEASGLRRWIRASYLRSRLLKAPALTDRLVARAVTLAGYDTSGLDKSLRFAPAAPARILDYGCGSGFYLLQLKEMDYDLHGAEYDPHLLGQLAQSGIAIHNVAALTDDHWDATFDHITLSHVLEHVPDPVALLSRLSRWLKPGGSLYVELPNADATGIAIFGRYWRGLEAPRHFALPSQKSLVAAFARAGLMIERQHIDPAARPWLWNKSLSASPDNQHQAMRQAMADAPLETQANAELLTFVARKPA